MPRKTKRETPTVGKRPRLDPRRRGFYLDQVLREGFADDPVLPEGSRLLIARWAERFTPERLSESQRELLAAAPLPSVSREQREFARNQRELSSPYLSALFDSLSLDDQRAVQDPRRAGITGTGYPLSAPQMARLTGASERQVRSWADDGLLPVYREGGERRFYSAAVIRAFALARAPGYSKAIAAAAARGEVGEHFQLLAATLAQAAARMPLDLRERLIALAEDLSSSSRLMADVSDGSELTQLWQDGVASEERGEGVDGVVVQVKMQCLGTAGHSLSVSQADETIGTRYGRKLVTGKSLVVTAPGDEDNWVNRLSGRKQALSVHHTKREAEARGREIAREKGGTHVIYLRNGSISHSRRYG